MRIDHCLIFIIQPLVQRYINTNTCHMAELFKSRDLVALNENVNKTVLYLM